MKPSCSALVRDRVPPKKTTGENDFEGGEKKANAWGLHDMQGNAWEWCSDWYDLYPKGAVSDPTGPEEGSYRVHRGGDWINVAAGCRSARRRRIAPSHQDLLTGFRVALSSSGIPK